MSIIWGTEHLLNWILINQLFRILRKKTIIKEDRVKKVVVPIKIMFKIQLLTLMRAITNNKTKKKNFHCVIYKDGTD